MDLPIDQIICGDNVAVMQTFPDACIDLTVTSPPYDRLRVYQGYSFDFEGVASQLWRVTKPGGVVVWVVGDATVKGSETGTSFRQALRFMETGFRLHDTMIYEKENPMPLNHNRYEQKFEYMFIMSKESPNAFNPLVEECFTKGTTRNWGTRVSGSARERGGAGRHREEVTQVRSHKLRGNIWGYKVGRYPSTTDTNAYTHPAIFPEALARDHILSWSNPGDVVLDPFNGSGTTCKMALLNDRHYIGIDVSAEYCEIAEQRIRKSLASRVEQARLFC